MLFCWICHDIRGINAIARRGSCATVIIQIQQKLSSMSVRLSCRNHHGPQIAYFDIWVIYMKDINPHRKVLNVLIDRHIKLSLALFLFLYLALSSDDDEFREFKNGNAMWCKAYMQMWIEFQIGVFDARTLSNQVWRWSRGAYADTYINLCKYIPFICAKTYL